MNQQLWPKLFLQILTGLVLTLRVTPAFSIVHQTKGVDGFNPTFYFDFDFGFTTYKSKMILNNDRSTHASYTLGGNGGSDREYGFFVKTDINTTSFELNQSKVASSWRDSVFRYRMGYVYAGVLFSQAEMQVNKEGTETMDAQGNGFGGNVGFQAEFGSTAVFYVDIVSASISSTKDTLSTTNSIGSRLDVDIGAQFDITKKSLDCIMGYRQRTVSVTTDASYSEELYTNYIGLRWALFF